MGNQDIISALISLTVLSLIMYFVWKSYQKSKQTLTLTPAKIDDQKLEGKFAITVLNVFAVISLLISIFTIPSIFAPESKNGSILIVFATGLFSYATLSALVVVIRNIIQIRKNTDK